MLKKMTFREIKNSLGRFLAILCIVALGVGFFSGLKVTREAMVATTDSYISAQQLYDFKIMSTLGYEDVDVENLREGSYVDAAEGSFNKDVLCSVDGSQERALIFHSLTKDVNQVCLKAGRMPEKDNECLADANMGGEWLIGKEIKLTSENSKDTLEKFKYATFTVTGICVSPVYLNFERGSTSLGNGSLSAFVYIPYSAFDVDYYSEIYLTTTEKYGIYTDEYNDYIDDITEKLKKDAKKGANRRFRDIVADANKELDDAKKEYADGLAEYEREKADALAELDDAYAQITDGRKTIADKKKELADNEKELKKTEKELSKQKKELTEKRGSLVSQKKELTKKRAELVTTRKDLKSQRKDLVAKKSEAEAGKANIEKALKDLDASRAQFELGKPYMSPEEAAITEATLNETEKTLKASLKEINAGLKEINDGLAAIDTGLDDIDSGISEIDDGLKQLNEGITQIDDGLAQITDGQAEIKDGFKQLEEGRKTISDKEKELDDGYQEYLDGKAEADREFAKAEAELAEADEKIKDAEADIADIEKPKTYVLDRNSNIGYACFENDSKIVDGIAKVFPIFFFLVAALVCMTTMTRMVDEQRTQIGVLKAMGYSSVQVAGKYLFYSGSAALIGCLIGFFGGCYLFPKVIWFAYGMMYDFDADIQYVINVPLAVISVIVSLICSMGATLFSCIKELREVPAQLIRPKAPKNGKRIMLERIPFIWNRLGFLYKVSFRNIFRYKKRFIMMIIGISGCTALLLTGLGLNDSVRNIVDLQYDEIQTFDYSVTFDKNMREKRQIKFANRMGLSFDNSQDTDNVMFVHQNTYDMVHGKDVKSVNLIVPLDEDLDRFGMYFDLHDKSGDPVAFPSDGEIVICRKLSNQYNISVGDELVLRDEDMNEIPLKVSGICENYVYNYVYVSESTVRKAFGKMPNVKTAFVKLASGDAKNAEDEVVRASAASSLDQDNVMAVSINNDFRTRVGNMMSSLDYVILLVIACAGALAFIVLYNLTNINITERIREIATIKVLGFYPGETASYVFRENVFLTGISAVVGLALGKALHAFVMSEIKIDMLFFPSRITAFSCIISVLLTFLFAILVNLAMMRRLDKINMAESLKSIE